MKSCIAVINFSLWIDDHRTPFIFKFSRALKEEDHTIRVVIVHAPGALRRRVTNEIEVHQVRYLHERLEVFQKEDGGMPVTWKKYPLLRLALLLIFLV